jgi:probable rRNA maturation factor
MASSKQDPDIIIHVAENFKDIDIDISPPEIKKLVKAVCNRFTGCEPRNTGYEVSIAIVDDNEIRELNRRFLNRKTTTDCLSFDLSDDEKEQKIFDLVVNGQMALRQANLRGHSGKAELALYITHGLLHNLGFDDSADGRARKMHQTEDEILQQLGYGLVYNKNTSIKEQ